MARKTFKKNICNPNVYKNKTRKSNTCLPKKTMIKLKKMYNLRHPDDEIKASNTNTSTIRNELKHKLQNVCVSERCWIEELNPENKVQLEKFFAPKRPTTWKKNNNTWLTTSDISRVMKQYETTYPNYKFLGPCSIDFEHKTDGGMCIYPEICNLNLETERQNGINIIGTVYNTDKHTQSGSHWICSYIDIDKGIFFFFDSVGDKCPREIKQYYNKLKRTLSQKKLRFKTTNGFEHQRGETECGMYCLYVLINLLEQKISMESLRKNRLSDTRINKFRRIYYDEL